MPFKNVLVGVDGRQGGHDAVALASALLATDGKLTLAHVHRGEVAEELRDTHELLQRERTEAGVEAELISVVCASPGRGLHEQAEERTPICSSWAPAVMAYSAARCSATIRAPH